MKKKTIRMLSLLLAFVMCASFVSAGQTVLFATGTNDSLSTEALSQTALAGVASSPEDEEYVDFEFEFPIEQTDNDNLSTTPGSSLELASTPITSSLLPSGVYALENVANSGLWMEVEQDKTVAGYHVLQNAFTTSPADSFQRSALFKFTWVTGTRRYIIRSMLNNRLGLVYENGELITKEIPLNDAEVEAADTLSIIYKTSGYMIRPYNDIAVGICAPSDIYATGDVDAPASYLTMDSITAAGDRSKWLLHPYTGTNRGGGKLSYPSSWNIGLTRSATYTASVLTWSTVIGANTPALSVAPSETVRATSTWNATNCQMTLTTQKAGRFELNTLVYQDGTETVVHTFTRAFSILPSFTSGETFFIKNMGTEKYMDIEGPSTAEGAAIQQRQYDGTPQSRWVVQRYSAEQYTIKSVYSNKYIGVDSATSTTIKQYATVNSYTLWRFDETNAGQYALVCSISSSQDFVLALPSVTSGTGANLTRITYTADSDYNDEWRVVEYDVSVLMAIDDFDGAARHTYFSSTKDFLETEKNGKISVVSTVRYSSCSVSDMVNYMKENDIFVIHTHGLQTGFKIDYWDSFLYLSDIKEEDLSNIQLALLMTCYTGNNYNPSNVTNNTPQNIVEQMVICGAETVIGFKGTTLVSDCNRFAADFFENVIDEGLPVKKAVETIDYEGYIYDLSRVAVIAGNENNKLR